MDQSTGPIRQFIAGLRVELDHTLPPHEAQEITLEIEQHLQELSCDLRSQYPTDWAAEREAVNRFGDSRRVGHELASVKDKNRLGSVELTALGIGAAATAIPPACDMAVSLLAYLNGSEFALYGAYAVSGILLIPLLIWSLFSRKNVFSRLAFFSFVIYVLWTVAGGLLQGAYLGGYSTTPRGLAYHTSQSLPDNAIQARREEERLRQGMQAFGSASSAAEIPDMFISREGFVVPSGQSSYYVPGFFEERPIVEFYSYEPDFSKAKLDWMAEGPKQVKRANEASENFHHWALDTKFAYHSSWLESVAAQFKVKTLGLVLWLGLLFIVNVGGFLLGGLMRKSSNTRGVRN